MIRQTLILAIALVCPAIAQPPPAGAAKGAVITGQVVNSKTGEPVRRVNLTLLPMGSAAGGGPVTGPGASPYAAATDAEGKYKIENIEPGTYRLMAERQGFVRQSYGSAGSGMGVGARLQLSSGQELKDINLKLIPHAVITGRVLDEEGEPVARVQVQAMRRRYMQGRQQLLPTSGGMTNDVGEYRLADLAPGRYWVSAIYRGRMAMGLDTPVRNPGGKPEEDYVPTYFPGAADPAGARALDLEAGQQLPGIDLHLQKGVVYRIRGRIAGDTESSSRTRVMLIPRDRGAMGMMFMGAGAISKEDGSFEIAGVRPGSYYVTAAPAQGMMTMLGKTPVDVTRENVEGVTLTLGSALTVSGKIRLPPDQKAAGLGAMRVQLMPAEGIAFNTPSAAAKEDGSFTLENVGPDKYRVLVFNPPQGTWLKSVRAGGAEVLDTGVDLSSGAVGPIEILLSPGAGRIAGAVLDAKGQPAAGSLVVLVPDPLNPDRADLQRQVASDQSGQFSLQGITPGNYKIYAWANADYGEATDPDLMKQHDSQAVKVAIRENGQEQVTLTQILADPAAAK